MINEDVYHRAFNGMLLEKKANGDEGDVFAKLVHFWQLELLFAKVLGREDFYADLYEEARIRRAAGTGGSNDGEYQNNFVKMVTDITGYDMTEYFEAWGYLTPVDRVIDDYGEKQLTVTEEDIAGLRSYIADKSLPVLPYKIQYITDENWEIYKEEKTIIPGPVMRFGNQMELSYWKNVVAFEVWDGDELIAITNKSTTTLPDGNNEHIKVLAVQYDGATLDVEENATISLLPLLDKLNLLLAETSGGSNMFEYDEEERAALIDAVNAATELGNNPNVTEEELIAEGEALTELANAYLATQILPFQISTETEEYWYRIHEKNSPSYYWKMTSTEELSNLILLTNQSDSEDENELFKLVKAPFPLRGFYIYGKESGEVALSAKSTNDNEKVAAYDDATPFSFLLSPAQEGYYLIAAEQNGRQLNSYRHTSPAFLSFYQGGAGDLGNNWIFILDEANLDREELLTLWNELKTNARKLYNNTQAGDYLGKFPQDARLIFFNAITELESKVAANLPATQLQSDVKMIKKALDTYKNSVISDISSITSTAENPKWFYISSMAANFSDIVAKVITSNGANENNFMLETKAGTDAQYWRFEAEGDGFRIINKATGQEFGAPAPTVAGAGVTYTVSLLEDGYSLNITSSGITLHSAGGTIVSWPGGVGGGSAWVLQQKDENLSNGVAIEPVVSTLEHPVYYYLFSAADGRKARLGSADQFTPYDFRDAALVASDAGVLMWDTPVNENALWALIDDAGVVKLRNKGTGLYMNETDGLSASGQEFVFEEYESHIYRVKNSAKSWLIPYNENKAAKWSADQGIYSQTSWCFVSPVFSGEGDISTAANWSTGAVPASDVGVVIDGDVVVSSATSMNHVQINTGKTLTVEAGVGLTVNNSSANNGILILQSDATNGTATLAGNVSGNAVVEQYVGSSRSWYMGIPFAEFAFAEGNVKGYDIFTESTRTWDYTLGSPTAADAGYGVMINPNSGVDKLTVSGELLSGDVVLENMTSDMRRFHFVGNPYPSFMKWSELGKENLDETIWFRTVLDDSFAFATLSGLVSSPEGVVDNNLPPMQGFWVRVEKDKKGKLTFPTAERKHYESGLKQLRAPREEEMTIVRLTVTDGTLKDETVIYFDENNSNVKDRLDAAKMMSNNRAEIYTLLDGEAIVINAMETIPYNRELPLGFRANKAGEYTISANQFKGFEEGVSLILTDHNNGAITNLTNFEYSFSTESGDTNDRFSLKFVPAVSTGVDAIGTNDISLAINNAGQIVVRLSQNPENAKATVYTVSGQLVAQQSLQAVQTTLTSTLGKGVYIVVVDNKGERMTERVVIK